MHRFIRRHYRWIRYLPRRKHLKGSWLHRQLGERLFAAALWKPSRQTVAGGLALGLFIGFTPTMGAQIILAGAAAYFLRVNVPMALAGSLVTNPFTAAIVYPLEYQLGVWLVGAPTRAELAGYAGKLYTFALYAKPLWVGSVVAGSIAAAIAYGLVTLLWKEVVHLRETHRHPSAPVAPAPHAGDAAAAALRDESKR